MIRRVPVKIRVRLYGGPCHGDIVEIWDGVDVAYGVVYTDDKDTYIKIQYTLRRFVRDGCPAGSFYAWIDMNNDEAWRLYNGI